MFISATDVNFLDDVKLLVSFQDGKIIEYDMSKMFSKYPQLKELRQNRDLFLSGKLDGLGAGIVWNDELDFSTSSIYEYGHLIGYKDTSLNQKIGVLITQAREKSNLTQTQLAKLSGIDQGDISKIELGQGNPTLKKLSKLIDALEIKVDIKSQNLKKNKRKL